MSVLRNLRLWLFPLRMADPDFGMLVFMYTSKRPERSYWECEWTFPKTNTVVVIAIRGSERGPLPEARQFYLSLPGRFEQVLNACRPGLERVFNDWLHQPLPSDVFSLVTLSGFDLDDPNEQPARWEVSFETRGANWLGITVPFVGDTAMEALVDT
jgi:hypothetical protein